MCVRLSQGLIERLQWPA